jgi:hypothetical protein
MTRRPFYLASALLASAVTVLARTPMACADFILTRASGVYQHTNGATKVILGTKSNAQGLFIVDGPAVSPQEFNLETMSAQGAHHVFIKFDAQAQPPTYSEIIINDKIYKISGNLTLGIGQKTIVSVDNNNPYLTVVTEGSTPGEAPSLLGFSGINEIVKGTGSIAAILAANQLNPEVAKVIRPYLVENDELMLNGKPVTTPLVGTFIKPESECLKPNSVILLSSEVTKIQETKTEDEPLKLLDQFIKESKKGSRLQEYLVLRTDPKSVILLDIKEKNVREMHAMVPKATKQRICVISDIGVK